LVVTAALSYDTVTAELGEKVLPETAIVEPASPVVGVSDIDGGIGVIVVAEPVLEGELVPAELIADTL